jgi:hypothetical protein
MVIAIIIISALIGGVAYYVSRPGPPKPTPDYILIGATVDPETL